MSFSRTNLYALGALILATCVSAESKSKNIEYAHGIMMGVAFAILFPFGAVILRGLKSRHTALIHGGWQAFAYIVALAAFGLGVWLAIVTDQLVTSNGHAIIGIIVIGVLLLQPIGGLLAHKLFVEKHQKTWAHYVHRWIGRVFLILGAINGGLGLQLSGNTRAGEIAYGVLAGFFFLLWLAVALYDNYKPRKKGEAEFQGEKKARASDDDTLVPSAGESV